MAQAPAQMTTQQARAAFFANATLRSQILPRQAYAASGTISFPLPKAGYGAFCTFDFQGSLVIGATGGSISLSPRAPYNLLAPVNGVVFQDYLGITRISASGWKLYQREISTKYGYDPSNATDAQTYSAALVEYSIGGGTGVAGTYPWQSSWFMPISLHENTTEGSFPFTIPQGQNTANLTFNALSGSTNESVIKVATAGFTLALTGTVGCTYYYWDVPKGTPIPTADFQLIHELREVKDASNITAGSEKRFPLPTGRTYYSILQDMVLNDGLDYVDVSEIRFIVDGNTPTLDETNYSYFTRVRRTYNRDFPFFYYDWWNKPWSPSQYGSLETGLTLAGTATTTGNTYTSLLLESLYVTDALIASIGG